MEESEAKDAVRNFMYAFTTDEERKCGGCNWPSTGFYVFAPTFEEAEQGFKSGTMGLCSDCMTELLADRKYPIVAP